MRASTLFTLALPTLSLASALAVSPNIAASILATRHQKRAAAPTSSTALSDMIGLITTSCNATCQVFINELTGCAAGKDQISIATCACSSQVLGDIRSCASCISADKTTTPANSTEVVADYNQFVNLCIADGLATVTGTVAVGASTSSLPRTLSSAPASVTRSTSIPTNATYEPTIAAGTATQVASLVVSGAPTTSGTGSIGAAAAASSKPASAGRPAVSLTLLVVAGAAVWGL